MSNDKVAKSLQTKYNFWKKKETDAMASGNADEYETAVNASAKLEAEAKEAGITLEVPAGADATPVAKPTGNGKASSGAKVPKSVKGAEQVAAKAKELAAKKANGTTADGKARVPRAKKEKVLQPCLDGCGTMVPGNFKMGHDAKLKSLILKVERGEEEQSAIPEIAQDLITFKKGEMVTEKDSKGQVKSKTQTYIVTKAPVRFPGRAEIQLTTR